MPSTASAPTITTTTVSTRAGRRVGASCVMGRPPGGGRRAGRRGRRPDATGAPGAGRGRSHHHTLRVRTSVRSPCVAGGPPDPNPTDTEGLHGAATEGDRRAARHAVAGARRHRCGRHRQHLPVGGRRRHRQHRHRLPGRVVRLRPDRGDRRLRPRPHLGRTLQPRRHARDPDGPPHRGARGDRVHRRPGGRRHPRLGDRARRRHGRRRVHARHRGGRVDASPPTASPTTRPAATPGVRRWWPRWCSPSSSCW